MIWGYRFDQVELHLHGLGDVKVRLVDGIVIFRRSDVIFTIREPNQDGMLPETVVVDAFDNAGLEPPPQPRTMWTDEGTP